MTDFSARRKKASALMKEHDIDAIFVMKPASLAWLTGDGRPCALGLLEASGEFVVAVPECDVPSMKRTSTATEIRSFRSEEDMFHGFRDVLASRGLTKATIALEKNFFDAALHDVFVKHILAGANVVPAGPVLSRARMIKDADEVELMRHCASAADAGIEAVAVGLRPGVRELDIAGFAESAMRSRGAEGWASPTYVASGWRSAMAHGSASAKPIEEGEVVQVHVSPIVAGYTVELCRTFFVGTPPPGASEARAAYIAAQDAGIAAATPGAPLQGIDKEMTAALAAHGFSNAFLRPVFHGVGLEHEEAPIPGGHAVIHGEEKIDQVEEGMMLAIGNCGIYRENFGVRFEDTVWVCSDGPKVLTSAPR